MSEPSLRPPRSTDFETGLVERDARPTTESRLTC
jgi:hypothetical protein